MTRKSDTEQNIRMAQSALRQMIRYLLSQGCSRKQILLAINTILDKEDRRAS